MSSAHRSCAACRMSSTRAATAIASLARTRRRQSCMPKATVEPYVFWRRDVNIRSELGALGTLSQTTIGARVAGQAAGAARLRRRDGAADEVGSTTDSLQRLGRTLADARVACPVGRHAEGHVRIQLRVRRRRSRPTARAARSISSIRRGTTSTAWPIRSAGGTSTTCAKASRSRRSRRRPISLNYHSWWLAERHRRALRRGRRAARPACRRWRGEPHVGQELDVQVTRAAHAAASDRWRLRPHLHRRASSSRRRPARRTATRTSWPRMSSSRRNSDEPMHHTRRDAFHQSTPRHRRRAC